MATSLLTVDNAYAPLLRLSLQDDTEEEEEGEGSEAAVQPRDLLPVGAKAAMVLEAKADIVDAERGLREIGLLDGRDVAGAGGLEGTWRVELRREEKVAHTTSQT